jgi:hypothetical protein
MKRPSASHHDVGAGHGYPKRLYLGAVSTSRSPAQERTRVPDVMSPLNLAAGLPPSGHSRNFQRLRARRLVQDLVQVHAAIQLSSVRRPSYGPMSEEERREWHDLYVLAVLEQRLVRELRRRSGSQASVGAWSVVSRAPTTTGEDKGSSERIASDTVGTAHYGSLSGPSLKAPQQAVAYGFDG